MDERHELVILPPAPATGMPFAWAALGDRAAAALELDFTSRDRPALVTAVLAACVATESAPDLDENRLWDLSLAVRIGGLAAVYAATSGHAALPLVLACPTCGEELEAPVPIVDLCDLAREAERTPTVTLETADGPVELRRPCGSDQRQWRSGPMEIEALRARIVASLVVAGRADPAALVGPAAELLEEFDPLPAFTIASRCPACGAEADHAVDLEDLLLGEIARAQARLFRDVHALASRYGWSEAEILAVPAHRRARYLGLIAAGADAEW